MTKLVTPWGTYTLYQFESEDEFERAVVAHTEEMFGPRRVYIDCKRRVGAKGGRQIIPDGYLIDFSRVRDPQLVVVESELASHDLGRTDTMPIVNRQRISSKCISVVSRSNAVASRR